MKLDPHKLSNNAKIKLTVWRQGEAWGGPAFGGALLGVRKMLLSVLKLKVLSKGVHHTYVVLGSS